MKRLSRFVFAIEALLLTYPTLIAVVLISGSIVPVATGARATSDKVFGIAVGIAVFLGLVCAWRLALSFLLRGATRARSVSRIWWIAATGYAVGALIVVAWSLVTDWNPMLSPLGLIGFGALFLPSYLHLCAEVWLRAG